MKLQQTYQKPMMFMCYIEEAENLLVSLSSGSQDNDQALSREWSHDDDATEPASRITTLWDDPDEAPSRNNLPLKQSVIKKAQQRQSVL